MTEKKQYCERCEKLGKFNQQMNMQILEPQQVKEKIQRSKIEYKWVFVYAGYNYFECPICGWFKFVKKEQYSKLRGKVIDTTKT